MKNGLTFFLVSFLSLSAFSQSQTIESWQETRSMMSHEVARLKKLYPSLAAKVLKPAENVTLPIEYHSDGSLKSEIKAKKAYFFLGKGKNNFVWGEGVVVRQYTTEGEVEAEIQAKACIVDRETKSGWAEGPARARYGATVVTGEGVYFSFEEEYVKITSKVEIISEDMKVEGIKL